FTAYPVDFSWEATTDQDAANPPHYDVWLDTLNDLSTAWMIGDSLAETALTVDEVPDDHTFFWMVRATDDNTEGTWADEVFSFDMVINDPPSPFNLDNPSGDTIGTGFPPVIDFRWYASHDPDLGSIVRYDLHVSHRADHNVQTFTIADIRDTIRTVRLYDYLENDYWQEAAIVDWEVVAISSLDSTNCNEPFRFYITPHLGVSENRGSLPVEFVVSPAFPNPFNPSTSLEFGLPAAGLVDIRVVNVLGVEVFENISHFSAGYHTFKWDAGKLPSGVYFVKITNSENTPQFQKLMLMK
ncbi:T9SS type A sorting domain-containing protein, partial [bacterium]|nr:T9SS type A sorting domain-containing protein [bacterium]